MQSALRWGAGLAAAGFAASRILGENAHRSRILGNSASHAEAAPGGVTKLHIYDHCPFCVRAQLVAGWKGIPHKVEVYNYGDFDGPIALTGKKQLPVLEYKTPAGETKYMPESLDIIKYLEGATSPLNPTQPTGEVREDLKAWIKQARPQLVGLVRGAILKMPVKDWEKPEDIIYAVNKYTTRFGFNYTEEDKKRAEHVTALEGHLRDLDSLLHSDKAVNAHGRSFDDIVLIPILRSLTSVKGVQWPEKVQRYVEQGCADAGVQTYSRHAV